jgi:uncharacterized protein YegP (UPF0339 family)
MSVEYFPGNDGQWYVRLRAANGQTVAVTEGYTRKWSARRSARRIGQAFGAKVVAER